MALPLRIFLALALVQLSQRLALAFEFDLVGGKGVKQFAPAIPASSFLEEQDDNAGFIASLSLARSGAGGDSPPGTRRLIQPPPLKKRAFNGAAAIDAALLRRRPYAPDEADDGALLNYYRSVADAPHRNGRYYFLNRI